MKHAAAETLHTMSLVEWSHLDEDVEGELVDGALEDEEKPTVLHEAVVMWLGAFFRLWASRRRGLVLGSEAKIAVAPRRGRKPDLSVYLPPNMPALDATLIRTAPFTVVEVLSPRPRDVRRDRIGKLGDYARAHVRYYWIVDPLLRTVEVLELSWGCYATALAASAGHPKAPGLARTIDLDALWSEIDALEHRRPARRLKPS